MELSVSSETTFFNMKLQLEICPQLRTGSSAEDTGRIDTSPQEWDPSAMGSLTQLMIQLKNSNLIQHLMNAKIISTSHSLLHPKISSINNLLVNKHTTL